MSPTIVVTLLVNKESVEEVRRSLLSVVGWRDLAKDHRIADVKLFCVCAESSWTRFEHLKWEFDLHGIVVRRMAFDLSRPIPDPPALELFREVEASIRGRDLVLLVAPGALLVGLNGLAESVAEIEAEERNVFIAARHEHWALPVAALFTADVQRAFGLMTVAADRWAIRVQRRLFSRSRYHRWGDKGLLEGIDPSGNAIDYDVRWLIGAIACAVEEQGELRLQAVDWAQ